MKWLSLLSNKISSSVNALSNHVYRICGSDDEVKFACLIGSRGYWKKSVDKHERND